ncbi:MAG: XRE family transcriptional regulator [Cuspidothrix sp.]
MSANIFADLGLPNSDEMLVKAELARKISYAITSRGLTQIEAAELLGIDQPKISALTGNIDLYDAFKKSEDGFIYQAIISENDNLDVVEIIFCENINDECLPILGETIDFNDQPFPLENKEKIKI